MSFPGTYNINYYKGDTYQFRIYPKDSSGNTFDLSEYRYDHDSDPNTDEWDTAIFAFAETRGGNSATGYHKCLAKISDNGNYVTCTIRPEDSSYLNPTKTYVYDVQVTKAGTDYPTVLTLLTGNITVTDQVTSVVGLA